MTRATLSMLVLLAACAPDLRDDYPFDGALPNGDYLTTQPQDDGTTYAIVDATNKSSYVYVDLDIEDELPAAQALETSDWDLSFQRFVVRANGGGSGPGSVEVAVIKDGDFDAMTVAPADGYVKDGADPVINTAEGGWYFYDLSVHKLQTREDLFYVVKTGKGAFFKLKMLSYYDPQGTAARMQLKWQKITAP